MQRFQHVSLTGGPDVAMKEAEEWEQEGAPPQPKKILMPAP